MLLTNCLRRKKITHIYIFSSEPHMVIFLVRSDIQQLTGSPQNLKSLVENVCFSRFCYIYAWKCAWFISGHHNIWCKFISVKTILQWYLLKIIANDIFLVSNFHLYCAVYGVCHRQNTYGLKVVFCFRHFTAFHCHHCARLLTGTEYI